MKAVLATLVCICLSTAALAQCRGSDQRTLLSAAERAELASRVGSIPFPQGNHWKATRGEQVIHVIGTVHLSDPRLDPVVERLEPLIEHAQVLMVEGTKAEQIKLKRAVVDRPELIFLTDGPTLPELMTESEWQEIVRAAKDRGIPPFMASKFQPWYLSIMLTMPACVLQQQAQGLPAGLDARLMDLATEHDTPQASLEPYDTIFELFNRDPLEQQIDYLRLGTLPNAVAEDGVTTLLNAYFEEKPAEVIEISRITARPHVNMAVQDLDVLMDDMLALVVDARNLAWMPAILDAPDGLSVVAVGAGHLPGETGLLNLLSEAGFTLERQAF